MKNKILFILIHLSISLCFFSCSDDNQEKDNQENKVTFKVYSNTPDALIVISELYGGTITIKDHWE